MPNRYNTSRMTNEELEDLKIKLVPGDVITVRPGFDKGCPCSRCKEGWSEALYANGDRQRGGWCPEQHILVGVKAGYVSRYCPLPSTVVGEVHDPGTLMLQPFRTIPAENVSVKGSEVLSHLSSADSSCYESYPRPHRERVPAGGWF